MTVVTIDGSEKKDGKANPNFGVPKFNLLLQLPDGLEMQVMQ